MKKLTSQADCYMPKLNSTKEILTIAEVFEQYPKEWVVLAVTGKDDSGFPAKGEVILSSPNEDEALQQAVALRKENKAKNIKLNLYFFYTGAIDDGIHDKVA